MRLRQVLALLTTAVVLTGCRDELTASGVRAVVIEPGEGWSDTLTAGELRQARVVIRDSITGARLDVGTLRWQTDFTEGLTFSGAGDTVAIFAGAPGRARVLVQLDRPGLRAPLFVRNVVVRPAPWSRSIAVGQPTRVALKATGIPGIEAALDTIFWIAGSPNLSLLATTPEPTPLGKLDAASEVIGLNAGQSVIGVTFAFKDPKREPIEALVPFFVDIPILGEYADDPWPTELQLDELRYVHVRVRSPGDTTEELDADDLNLQLRSTNPSVLRVDSDYRLIWAVGRGSAELVATVGGDLFQVTEYRRSIQVMERWSSISTGYRHSCASNSARVSYCWGNNTFGELGIGILGGRSNGPSPVGSAVRFEQLVAGGVDLPQKRGEFPTSTSQAHSCGRAASYVFCWGANNNGQLGDGRDLCYNVPQASGCRQALPREVYDGSKQIGDVVGLSSGGQLTCAASRSEAFDIDGAVPAISRVSCWGGGYIDIDFGSLWSFGARPFSLTLYQRLAIPQFDVTAGGAHACFPVMRSASSARQVYCMGDNRWGQLGDGSTLQRPRTDTGTVAVGETEFQQVVQRGGGAALVARSIAAGGAHSCALDGTLGPTSTVPAAVWCWGANDQGQLGTTSLQRCDGVSCSRVAALVNTSERFVAVAAGGAHSCALTRDGVAWCWGDNRSGQLGLDNEQIMSSVVPRKVMTAERFTSIAAGGAHTCALTADGAIWCWGRNAEGQLGLTRGTGPLIRQRSDIPLRITEPTP